MMSRLMLLGCWLYSCSFWPMSIKNNEAASRQMPSQMYLHGNKTIFAKIQLNLKYKQIANHKKRGNALGIRGSLGLNKVNDYEERDDWTECPFWRHPFWGFLYLDWIIVYLICAAFYMNSYYMYCIFLLHDRQRLSDIVELGFNFVYRLWFYILLKFT